MELNGVANMKMLIDEAKGNTKQIDPILAEQLLNQLDLLERYILAIKDHTDSGYVAMGTKAFEYIVAHEKPIPYWHELIRNREEYKTNKERHGG